MHGRLLSLLLLLLTSPALAQDEMQAIYKLCAAGRVKECRIRAEAYLKDHPDDPGPPHVLGRLWVRQDARKAEAYLKKCLELSPRPAWMTAWTHVALGEAYAKMGKKPEAVAHLKKALALNATRNATTQARQLLARLEKGKAPPRRRPSGAGKPLPDFTLRGIHGEVYTREDFKACTGVFKFGPSW